MAEQKKSKKVRRIIPLKNKDKTFQEKWQLRKNGTAKNLAWFPHSFRMCILGEVGGGKSTLAKNILIQNQLSKKPFKNVYLIHGDVDNSQEWSDIDYTQAIDGENIPSIDFWKENKEKSLIIIDDVEFTKTSVETIRNISKLFRYVSSHHGYSIILLHQSFFDVPSIIKKCSNVFILFPPSDFDQLGTIARRMGVKKEEMIAMCSLLTSNHDTLCIDLTENSPAKFRKNVFERIVKE